MWCCFLNYFTIRHLGLFLFLTVISDTANVYTDSFFSILFSLENTFSEWDSWIKEFKHFNKSSHDWRASRSIMSDSLQPHRLHIVHGILQARILEWVAFPSCWHFNGFLHFNVPFTDILMYPYASGYSTDSNSQYQQHHMKIQHTRFQAILE